MSKLRHALLDKLRQGKEIIDVRAQNGMIEFVSKRAVEVALPGAFAVDVIGVYAGVILHVDCKGNGIGTRTPNCREIFAAVVKDDFNLLGRRRAEFEVVAVLVEIDCLLSPPLEQAAKYGLLVVGELV